jgi:3-methyladenine DNA glycosylase AlkD
LSNGTSPQGEAHCEQAKGGSSFLNSQHHFEFPTLQNGVYPKSSALNTEFQTISKKVRINCFSIENEECRSRSLAHGAERRNDRSAGLVGEQRRAVRRARQDADDLAVFEGFEQRPEWEPLIAPHLALAPSDEAWLHDAARLLRARPEREFVYIAAQLLKAKKRALTAATLARLEELIPKNAWRDSVDALVGHALTDLVARFPELADEMDRWSREENPWLRRAALTHPLGRREKTDEARLFTYCRENATDPDFFIRKAIGWALRSYAATNSRAVRAFVAENREILSPLSVREALKHLER